MDALSLFHLKGGVGKSTLTPILAAAIKATFPDLTVGVIACDSANGTLAKIYSKDLEEQDQGLWNIIHTLVSRKTQGRVDLLEESIRGAVRPLTIVPGECAVDHRQEDFYRAARALGLDPSSPIERRQIQFIGTAQFLSLETASLPILNQLDSHELVGVPLLQAIERVLGWDVCLLDLPGEAGDRLVRILTHWCTCVAIPADVYKPANLTMEGDVLATLKAMSVTPAGFLANKASGTAASKRAINELEAIASQAGLEILGVIRELPTLATANSAFDRHGREWIPQDPDWTYPEGGWHVGLYRAALDFRTNESIRAVAAGAAREIEKVAMAMIRTTPQLAARLSEVCNG